METVLLFFDTGSQRSCIDISFARRLGPHSSPQAPLFLARFGSKDPMNVDSRCVLIGAQSVKGGSKVLFLSAVNYVNKKLQLARIRF